MYCLQCRIGRVSQGVVLTPGFPEICGCHSGIIGVNGVGNSGDAGGCSISHAERNLGAAFRPWPEGLPSLYFRLRNRGAVIQALPAAS